MFACVSFIFALLYIEELDSIHPIKMFGPTFVFFFAFTFSIFHIAKNKTRHLPDPRRQVIGEYFSFQMGCSSGMRGTTVRQIFHVFSSSLREEMSLAVHELK